MDVVEFSPGVLVAPLSASAAGFIAILVRLLAKGARLRQLGRVIARSLDEFLVVGIIDLFGGALIVAGALVLGITRPVFLVDLLDRQAVLGWLLAGAAGPLVSSGLLDRGPEALQQIWPRRRPDETEMMMSSRRRSRAPETTVGKLRGEPVRRIFLSLYEEQRVDRLARGDLLKWQAREHFNAGKLQFDDVATEAEQYSLEALGEPLPEIVTQVLDRRKNWPTDTDPGTDTIVLVDTLVDLGMHSPVTICCREAAARRDR